MRPLLIAAERGVGSEVVDFFVVQPATVPKSWGNGAKRRFAAGPRGAPDALIRAHANITLALMYLFGDERVFFHKRYVEGKKYEIIMREMHIARRTSCRLRADILDKIRIL